jgi:hypothetical protein
LLQAERADSREAAAGCKQGDIPGSLSPVLGEQSAGVVNLTKQDTNGGFISQQGCLAG